MCLLEDGSSVPFSAIRVANPSALVCASGIPYYQNCITFTAGPASNGGTDFGSAAFKSNKNGPSAFNRQSWFKPASRPAGTNGSSDPGVPLSNAAFVDQNREGVGWARPYTPGLRNDHISMLVCASSPSRQPSTRHRGDNRSEVSGRRLPAQPC